MGPKRKASAPPSASASAARGGASPAANPKSPVGTADDDARSWSTLADRVRAHGGVVHANVRVGADASGVRGARDAAVTILRRRGRRRVR